MNNAFVDRVFQMFLNPVHGSVGCVHCALVAEEEGGMRQAGLRQQSSGCHWHGAHGLIILFCIILFTGCAKLPPGESYDPAESVNRPVYSFNDTLDSIFLGPLSRGYVAVTSESVRESVSNFFDNAAYGNTILNDFLQGKGGQGFSDIGRLLVNTTLGIGGLFDVATSVGLKKHEEDFGQTLGVWGSGPGAYAVYPLLGPNTMRDTPDLAVELVTNGLFYAAFFLNAAVTIPIAVLSAIDERSRAENSIRFVNELALDPYVFTREAWLQHRDFLIYDGNPPEPEFEDEEDFNEEDIPAENGATIGNDQAPAGSHKEQGALISK